MMDIFGGKLVDAPLPHRRQYTKKGKKRPLRLSVIVYSIGKHYWASLHEDDNPIYDLSEKCWRLCWDDAQGRGRIESRQCNNPIEVRRWVRHMLREVFTHHNLKREFLEEDVEKLFVYPEHD